MAGAALILVGVWLVLQGLVGGLSARLLALSQSVSPAAKGEGGGFTGDKTTPTAGGGGGGGAW